VPSGRPVHHNGGMLDDVLGPPVQIAYVVDDVWKAADSFAKRFGAGPFFVMEHITVTDVFYRGEPSVFDHSSAYGQWGKVMVELFVQHNDDPTAVRQMYRQGETGLHHLAYFAEDFEGTARRLTELGFPQAQIAKTGRGNPFAFHDATAELGHMIELYEPLPGIVDFYAMVASAAESWDGSEPARPVELFRR
jgi:hypothetical protein